MHCKNPALDATTTHCSLFTNTSRHDRFAAATTLQSGLATAAAHITNPKKLYLQATLQDEAKDDAKKEKNLNDFPDLTERSGRAVKIEYRAMRGN